MGTPGYFHNNVSQFLQNERCISEIFLFLDLKEEKLVLWQLYQKREKICNAAGVGGYLYNATIVGKIK